jgi:hypothetical protein
VCTDFIAIGAVLSLGFELPPPDLRVATSFSFPLESLVAG